MKKEFPCMEQTMDLSVGEYDVRLWINLSAVDDFNPEQPINVPPWTKSLKDIVRFFIENIPNLNAVQVRKHHSASNVKDGLMVYTVPFEDKEEV